MNACEKLNKIDSEGNNINCKKLPRNQKETADMARALKREIELQNTKEQNLGKLVENMNQFLSTSSAKKKEVLLREIEKISQDYPRNIDFIEKMGFFSWERFMQEKDQRFLLATAHRVAELSWLGVIPGGEFANLQDDFYGMMLTQLEKTGDTISPLLQRIFEILGDSFQEWLQAQLSENSRIADDEKAIILRRYVNYRGN